MLKAIIYQDNAGNICGFEFEGHAGRQPEGENLLCAYASAVVQTAVLGLEDVVKLKIRHQQSKGKLQCFLPEDMSPQDRHDAEVVCNTMIKGLESINYTKQDTIVHISFRT